MTEIVNVTTIAAPARTIFALASATERWPEILPHYRSVRVLGRRGATRVVAMAAMRGAIPISWVAEQIDDAELPQIRFRHVRGWTRGMDVVWRFQSVPGGTRVSIEHDLVFRFPIASKWLGDRIVGKFFIDYVATRTLARIKALAEAAS